MLQESIDENIGEIPGEALDSIWYGISHLPKRPQLCKDTEDIFEKAISEEEFNAVVAIASTNTAPLPTGLTFNMIKKWPEDVKSDIHSSLLPVVNKRSTNTMGMEMAQPKTEDRLGNTNSWRPTPTIPAGLPEEAMGEAHSGKNNFCLGNTQYTQRSQALQFRSRLLSRPPPLPICSRDSTRDGHRCVHVIVGCTEGVRRNI